MYFSELVSAFQNKKEIVCNGYKPEARKYLLRIFEI